uniref:Restriction endonuclease n=1 Tax=Candidatus Kentrum sp. LFY TaxID=2126342 RepID=A0A450UV38_9GAMM|nr:MAG: Putative restriction endonuclease [Candidatus Kentron sp. LFY]
MDRLGARLLSIKSGMVIASSFPMVIAFTVLRQARIMPVATPVVLHYWVVIRTWSGSAVDAGFTPNPGTLRAPDVAVGPPPGKKQGAWIAGVPPLAVEYADKGQDETDLEIKIRELLTAGTRYVWVVRLTGPQRVEVHTKDGKRLLSASDVLKAPGILRNPIPVHALFDEKEALRVTLRNLLQRQGYEDLEAVLREGVRRGKVEGRTEGSLAAQVKALFGTLTIRGIDLDAETRARVRDCRDPVQLEAWLMKAVVADRLEDVFGGS